MNYFESHNNDISYTCIASLKGVMFLDHTLLPPLVGPGEETYVEKPRPIADMFNRFFFSTFLNLNESNLSHSLDDIHSHFSRESAKLSEITLNSEDVLSALKSIGRSKAWGTDNIPARILVECAEELSPSLTDLNGSLQTSCHC